MIIVYLRILKSVNSFVGSSHLMSKFWTFEPGGPILNSSKRLSNFDLSPSAIISTLPSDLFLTEPDKDSLLAVL